MDFDDQVTEPDEEMLAAIETRPSRLQYDKERNTAVLMNEEWTPIARLEFHVTTLRRTPDKRTGAASYTRSFATLSAAAAEPPNLREVVVRRNKYLMTATDSIKDELLEIQGRRAGQPEPAPPRRAPEFVSSIHKSIKITNVDSHLGLDFVACFIKQLHKDGELLATDLVVFGKDTMTVGSLLNHQVEPENASLFRDLTSQLPQLLTGDERFLWNVYEGSERTSYLIPLKLFGTDRMPRQAQFKQWLSPSTNANWLEDVTSMRHLLQAYIGDPGTRTPSLITRIAVPEAAVPMDVEDKQEPLEVDCRGHVVLRWIGDRTVDGYFGHTKYRATTAVYVIPSQAFANPVDLDHLRIMSHPFQSGVNKGYWPIYIRELAQAFPVRCYVDIEKHVFRNADLTFRVDTNAEQSEDKEDRYEEVDCRDKLLWHVSVDGHEEQTFAIPLEEFGRVAFLKGGMGKLEEFLIDVTIKRKPETLLSHYINVAGVQARREDVERSFSPYDLPFLDRSIKYEVYSFDLPNPHV